MLDLFVLFQLKFRKYVSMKESSDSQCQRAAPCQAFVKTGKQWNRGRIFFEWLCPISIMGVSVPKAKKSLEVPGMNHTRKAEFWYVADRAGSHWNWVLQMRSSGCRLERKRNHGFLFFFKTDSKCRFLAYFFLGCIVLGAQVQWSFAKCLVKTQNAIFQAKVDALSRAMVIPPISPLLAAWHAPCRRWRWL